MGWDASAPSGISDDLLTLDVRASIQQISRGALLHSKKCSLLLDCIGPSHVILKYIFAAGIANTAIEPYVESTWFLRPCQTKHFCLSDPPLRAPDEPNTSFRPRCRFSRPLAHPRRRNLMI